MGTGFFNSFDEVKNWGYPQHFDVLSSISSRLTEDEKQALQALFQMGGLKSPGSDGIIAAFYQKHWNLIGDGIMKFTASSACVMLHKSL